MSSPSRQPPLPVTTAVPDAPPAVRAQLLATEHWSLLATRSMTWSEVMSRISAHLTVASASLVVLALVAQVAGFGPAFRILSIGLTSAILVIGQMTGVRVWNASEEDASLVRGMNRLRAAYVEIDPAMSRYLVTSWHDDAAGVMSTYTVGNPRRYLSHVAGGTAMFMNVVNTIVAGTLAALIAHAAGARPAAISVIGLFAAAVYLFVIIRFGWRRFGRMRTREGVDAEFPSTATE